MARREGKVVEIMTFRIDGQEVKVAARMEKEQKWSFQKTYFYARETAPVQLYFKEESINALRDKVQGELKAKLSMTWVTKIVVSLERDENTRKISEDMRYDRVHAGATLNLRFESQQEGTNGSGQKFHRTYPGQHIYEGAVGEGYSAGVIDDTQENREALNRFVDAVVEIKKKIRELIEPAKLQETLALILAGPPALALGPAPPPEVVYDPTGLETAKARMNATMVQMCRKARAAGPMQVAVPVPDPVDPLVQKANRPRKVAKRKT